MKYFIGICEGAGGSRREPKWIWRHSWFNYNGTLFQLFENKWFFGRGPVAFLEGFWTTFRGGSRPTFRLHPRRLQSVAQSVWNLVACTGLSHCKTAPGGSLEDFVYFYEICFCKISKMFKFILKNQKSMIICQTSSHANHLFFQPFPRKPHANHT